MSNFISASKLKSGMISSAPVYSKKGGGKIVDGNTILTRELIGEIKRGGVKEVPVKWSNKGGKPAEASPDEMAKANLSSLLSKTAIRSDASPAVLERNFMQEDGKATLKIDSKKAKEAHTASISKTTKAFEKIRASSSLDVLEIKDTANSLVEEVVDNPQAFSNLCAIRTKDEYTYSHSVDVAILAVIVGSEFQMTDDDLKTLGFAALLHDVGKMFTPDKILNKRGRFEPVEREEMKRHTTQGGKVLKAQRVEDTIVDVAVHHHEWVDGSGYPDGIGDSELGFMSKVVGICDVFNALTTQRIYKPAIPAYKSMQIISGEVGNHFDREIALLFQRIVGVYPNGTLVELSDESICRVIDQNYAMPMRPIVQEVQNTKKEKVEEGFTIVDLAEKKNIYIKRVILPEQGYA